MLQRMGGLIKGSEARKNTSKSRSGPAEGAHGAVANSPGCRGTPASRPKTFGKRLRGRQGGRARLHPQLHVYVTELFAVHRT